MKARVICVCNFKGGTAKTTSSVFLAHACARQGRRVALVDADPTRSALSWSEQAGFPFPVLGLPVRNLHQQLPGIVADDVDDVVIDTPPIEDYRGVVQSAMRLASLVVITMAPTMMELDRVEPVYAALADVEPLRVDGLPPAAVLLNRVVANASSTGAIRGVIEGQGRRVLAATVGRREMYAQAFGGDVADVAEYGPVLDELTAMMLQ